MIAQFGNICILADGWDVRMLKFKSPDAARAWCIGSGLVRISKAKAINSFGNHLLKFGLV